MTASIAYLDCNASAPLLPGVREAIDAALQLTGNPSSVHRAGREVRRAVERGREAVAALVGARPRDVVFTSGGTEANALALAQAGDRSVAVSAIEHESVLLNAGDAVRLPVIPDGTLDLGALKAWLAGIRRPAYLSLMLANNETGVIQPVAEAARLAHKHGVLVHCDAAQAAGRVPVSWGDLGVDLMTVSAHKMGGPKGIGALIAPGDIATVPLFRGGGQERGLRAGTENLPGIVGFGRAAELAAAAWQSDRIEALRDDLEARIGAGAPEAIVYGAAAARLSNTSCIGLPGAASEEQVIALDLVGFCVSAGSACSSGKVTPSHVLGAMGHDAAAARSAIRVSLGPATTARDVEQFAKAWLTMRMALTGRAPAIAR
ncbi:MAG: cysteine desulfurase family protein [Alphaproteobacteria bacterium]